jgi:hypothetical protein
MKKITLLAAVFAAFAASAQTKLEGLSHPESVCSNGKFTFVSNLGEKVEPTKRDEDGFISKFDAKGAEVKKDFISGLNAPKGMAIVKDVLYVADLDQIRGFKIKDGKEVFNLDLADMGSTYLNDIVMIDEQTLIVSATDIHKLIKVNLKTKKGEELSIAKLPSMGCNGLTYDAEKKMLFVVGMGGKVTKGDDVEDILGEIGMINLAADPAKWAYKRIGKATGMFDGIAIYDEKTLIVSDWRGGEGKGCMWKIDRMSGKATEAVKMGAFAGPADFYFNAKENSVMIPDLLGDSVYPVTVDFSIKK